jgi:TrmH RNA methyltransferase
MKPQKAAVVAQKKTVGKDEQRYYGQRQCATLFKLRPQDIINVHLLKPMTKEFSTLLKWCADHRKAYHYCESDELDKLAKSQHHEGIVVLAKKKALLDEQTFTAAVTKEEPQHIVLLDGVENPHNLGAILRSAAFFGINFICIEHPDAKALPAVSCRIAEGGAEFLICGRTAQSDQMIHALKKLGYRIIILENHAKTDLDRLKTGTKTVFVLGAEGRGVARLVKSLADQEIRITGNGSIGSLNVAAAASVVFHHLSCR